MNHEIYMPMLDIDIIRDIKSCIKQQINSKEPPTEFNVISVWFADMANKYLKSNTPDGSYCVMYKFESNYTRADIIKHAKKIWNAELYPVEIIYSGGAIFYAFPKKDVYNKNISEVKLLKAEDDLPELWEFKI